MGYKTLDKSRGFQPGVSGNVRGGQLHNHVSKKIKVMTTSEIDRLGALLLNGTLADLQAILQNPSASVLERWMASIMLCGIKKGDHKAWSAILDRLVGKVKERTDIAPVMKTEIELKVEAMTSEERTAFVIKTAKDLENILEVGGGVLG